MDDAADNIVAFLKGDPTFRTSFLSRAQMGIDNNDKWDSPVEDRRIRPTGLSAILNALYQTNVDYFNDLAYKGKLRTPQYDNSAYAGLASEAGYYDIDRSKPWNLIPPAW